MADRTWNAVDGALYEEDWTQAAKLIAGVLLARCPNQYGVFKMPFWFLKLTFKGIYNRAEIDGVIAEWIADGWITYYPETETVWIRNKWSRCEPNPGQNNVKGAINHLKRFPEVLEGFKARYRGVFNSLTPVEPPSDPPSTPDPDPDPEKKTDMSPTSVADGSLFSDGKKKKLSRDHTDWLKSDKAQVRVVGYFVNEYLKLYGFKPQLEFKSVFPNANTLLKRGMSEKLIREKIDAFLAIDPEKTDDYTKKIVEGHLWKMFIKHVDRIKAKTAGRKDPRAAQIERMTK
jgi:hypothetical protein